MAQAAPDPFDLARFVAAQAAVHARVQAELAAGAKTSHWMWFVFPQVEGLGVSPMAQRYALRSLAEARAYLAHPVLGPRLRGDVGLVLDARGRSLRAIFGTPDDLKFRSSMTLFAAAAPDEAVFAQALTQLCGGPDPETLRRLPCLTQGRSAARGS